MKYLKSITLFLFIAFLAGCSATGSSFVKPEASSEKSTIVFYRPSQFQAGARRVMLVDNGKQIQRIQSGQYIIYKTNAGEHEFRTDTMEIDKAITLKTEPGKIYYIRLDIAVGAWTGSWILSRIYEDQALEQLKKCKSGE